MKIVFAGGGSGGHFYPIIAVVEEVNDIVDHENIIGAKLYYFSDSPYDREILFENWLLFEQVSAGKRFSQIFKILFGFLNALYKMFSIYPDVVFGKGGYASFPTILAARILRIPAVIHESDSTPGRVNRWAGRFARKVAVSFAQAAEFFPEGKVAWTGQPIRKEVAEPAARSEALEFFKFESGLPVVLIIGGSQGAELINNTVLDALPRLVESFQVIHQTGVNNWSVVSPRVEVILSGNPNRQRYVSKPFLNGLELKMASGAATLVVSRAGSTLFEIAKWGVPSILVPITRLEHQRKNAFNYAREGACSVVEEANMTGNILFAEIARIAENKNVQEEMSKNAKAFSKPDAAAKIARALVDMAMSHESR